MSGSGIKISVVVPAYQAEGTIGRLVESLGAQTLPQEEFEVVVVDDGSTDGSRAVIEAYGATVGNTIDLVAAGGLEG